MKIGIPREIYPGEQRVAATPATVARLVEMGFEVVVETRAGRRANHPDEQYVEAGATVADGPEQVWAEAHVVLKVCEPTEHPGLGRHEAELAREGQVLISFLWPAQNGELVERLAARKVTAIAMDQVPRISRAQKMDALSSMANIAGYRAVIEAAHHYGSFFTGQITAAGRVPPAKVLVIGAGVAGLAAIAAAKGLGAIVRAFDTREAVSDQVESLGAEFLHVDVEESGEGAGGYAKEMSEAFIEAEMALFRQQAREVDIVITTALIPGKPAPKLWTADMVEAMKHGSVVVDLASVQGGNCELTRPGEVAVEHGVTIVGFEDLSSRLATTASQLYGTNLVALLEDMGGAEGFRVDLEDEVVRSALVLHEGMLTWPPPKAATPPPEPPARTAAEAAAGAPPPVVPPPRAPRRRAWLTPAVMLALVALWVWARATQGDASVSPEARSLMQHLTVFVLACFVGWQVVWAVTPALHTPLMSVTNAISGIIIIGGLLAGTSGTLDASRVLGLLATFFAMINVAGGFLVTQRMLRMFRKD